MVLSVRSNFQQYPTLITSQFAETLGSLKYADPKLAKKYFTLEQLQSI